MFSPLKTHRRISHTYAGKIATECSKRIWIPTLAIYLPLAVVWTYLFSKINYLALPLLLVILLSPFWFCKYNLTKVYDEKFPKIREEIYKLKSCKECFYCMSRTCDFYEKYIMAYGDDPGDFVACEKFEDVNGTAVVK